MEQECPQIMELVETPQLKFCNRSEVASDFISGLKDKYHGLNQSIKTRDAQASLGYSDRCLHRDGRPSTPVLCNAEDRTSAMVYLAIKLQVCCYFSFSIVHAITILLCCNCMYTPFGHYFNENFLVIVFFLPRSLRSARTE